MHLQLSYPLLKRLHYTSEAPSELDNKPFNKAKTGIMNTKIQEIIRGHPNISSKDVLRLLTFSDVERDHVERTTTMQWQCEEWYIHKAGFITASRCKRVFTRQEAIEKNEKDVTKLVKDIVLPESPHGCGQNQEVEPQNPREWGLFHEESARRAYQRVASHTHHKLELVSKGFLISKSKPFLGASVDNIQRCQCSDGCPNKVLEYKCPWKHRDMHPKEAFLTPEIGGTVSKNGFALKPSEYYFQLQLQMFQVSELSLSILVVWTKQGVFTVEVPFNASFMTEVCSELEMFWFQQILPFMMNTLVSTTSFPGM